MSNRRKIDRPARLDPWDDDSGLLALKMLTVVDLSDKQLVHDAMHESHDDLIFRTGARRISGVRWQILSAAEHRDAIIAVQEASVAEPSDRASNERAKREMLAIFDECPNAGVVIAQCIVSQMPGSLGLS